LIEKISSPRSPPVADLKLVAAANGVRFTPSLEISTSDDLLRSKKYYGNGVSIFRNLKFTEKPTV